MNHSHRRGRVGLRVVAPLAVCALALTACSGGDSDSEADAAESSPTQQSESPAPEEEPSEPAAEESATSGTDDAGPAPESQPGGERKPGESGIRAFEEDDATPVYEIVPEKVDVGTNADAREQLSRPDQAKDNLLAIAKVKFTYRGGDPVPRFPKVGKETSLYADGQPAAQLITFGGPPPEGCDRASTIEEWKNGQSYILCESFLIPPDTKSFEVYWGEDDGDPFVWKLPR